MKKLILFCGFIWCFTSCHYNSLDDLQLIVEESEMEDEGETPMESNVTYEDVRFIFNETCIQCHSNPPTFGAPNPLTNYVEVRESILNNETLDRISRNEREGGLMPLGGPRLPQELIDLVFQWNEDGLLEN